MGTNYYIHLELEPKLCPHCGEVVDRPVEELHIGKSSYGWCFGLHVIPEKGINSLEDWTRIWGDSSIWDEYQHPVSHEEMLEIITEREGKQANWVITPYGYTSWAEFHERNYSEKGPRNLLRHKIDDRFCVAHGEGTWDCLIGEFS